MLTALLVGSLAIIVNLTIQVIALVVVIRYLLRRVAAGGFDPGIAADIGAISVVLGVLFAGHLLQFGSWALLFVALGEFESIETAFYHSTVNFSSLGYGDIVMSERWRLLGGLEAANGVLMFGLTAGALLSVMSSLFQRHRPVVAHKKTEA